MSETGIGRNQTAALPRIMPDALAAHRKNGYGRASVQARGLPQRFYGERRTRELLTKDNF